MFRINVILAIAAVILAIPTAWTMFQDRTVFLSYEDVPRLFEGFTRDNVQGVVISRPRRDPAGQLQTDESGTVLRDSLQLVRTGDDWAIAGSAENPIAGVPVSAARVYDRILQHFESIRRDGDALIQENATPDELKAYGLDESLLIQCFDVQRAIAELCVGDDASRGQAGEDVVRGFFVRNKDDSDVVLYEHPYWVIDLDPAQWYERSPLRFAVDQAVEVSIHNLLGAAKLVRENAQAPDWVVAEAPDDVGAVRNGEIRAIADSVSMLSVASYVRRLPAEGSARQAILAESGLVDSPLWVEVALADGTRHRLTFGSDVPGTNERFAQLSSFDYLMTVSEWVPARFEKDPAIAYFDPK